MSIGWSARRWGIAAAALASFAAGEAAADPLAGKELAARWCAECHAIDAKGASPNRAAPRFVELAANPAITEYTLRHLLRSPHATMPHIKLDDDQMDDLVGYVLSLKPHS